MTGDSRFAAHIRPGERLDDLQRGGLHILQRPDGFCFGMDAVLLAAFATERIRAGLAVDLGTGSGVIPLLAHARRPGLSFDAVEIQPEMADMAARTMRLNGVEDSIRVRCLDVREATRSLGHERYRLAVSNPPYGGAGEGLLSPDAQRRMARHAVQADIDDFCRAAGGLLQNGGRFAVIFPAPRLLALMDAMRAGRVEPKRVRMVHPRWGSAPNLALVEGIKAAKPALLFMPPLYIRDESGRETQDLLKIYREGEAL